jgi:beta-glucuronidase
MPEYADYAGIAWYRRQLTLPPMAGEAQVRLCFGAVFYLAQVWWNGVYLGEHEGGYTPFEFDVSGLALPGEANVLTVRVDNQRAMDRLPAALLTHWAYDWWHYGGIVREVALHLSSRAFPVRLVGLTRHADSPAYGLAEPVTVLAADFSDLKRLNAVLSRPIYYPQADSALDYADRHGLLLIPEIPVWQLSATQLAHPRLRALAQQQLQEMIHSHANHPAVWAWSVGNEFASDTAAGHAFVRQMIAVAKSLDPTRPAGFASNRLGHQPWADATALADIVMINAYFGTWSRPKAKLGPTLDAIHAVWPDKPVIVSEYGFAARWEWIHRRAGGDVSQYYTVSPERASDTEAADRLRQQLIHEQLPVFRNRPFVAGAVFFTYQDHRTPNKLMMGVVDAQRQRRDFWAVLREAYAPAGIDAVHMSQAVDGTCRATVILHTRGPVERDLPAYSLRGYRLAWTVAAPEEQEVWAQGIIDLPTLHPGVKWSGAMEWTVPIADYRLMLRLLRPTGFAVLEHTYNAHGGRQ